MVKDNCGIYGTFCMDLTGNSLKTFNSPGRCPKMLHSVPHQQRTETIQIFTQPVTKNSGSQEAPPWKQVIRPQPRMGVLRESWEKNHSEQGDGLNTIQLHFSNIYLFFKVLKCVDCWRWLSICNRLIEVDYYAEGYAVF